MEYEVLYIHIKIILEKARPTLAITIRTSGLFLKN